jgi:hypothetical protein
MDYKLKYYKYKNKYISLKSKIIGGKLPETQNYKIVQFKYDTKYSIVIRECDKKDSIFHNYKILINKNVSQYEIVNICIIYSSDIINEIKVYINNINIKRKKENYYTLKFNNETIINEIIITYNDNEIEKYNNIELVDELKKYLFDLNFASSDLSNIYDECIFHINSLEKNKDTRIKKIASIMACTKMRSKFNDSKSLKYVNLMKFIHNVIYLGILNSDKDKLSSYAEQLIKLSIPIHVPSSSIQIQNGKEYSNLSNDFKVEVDSGNSFYTLISSKFYKLIEHESGTDIANVCLHSEGIGGGKLECTELVKFKIKIYDKEFTILSVVDNSKKVKDETDILFGSKGGIDLFFKNGMAIDTCNSDEQDKLLITYGNMYTKKIDALVIKFYDKFSNNKNLTSKNIDKFIIKYMKELLEYNKNIKRDISCNLTDINDDYYEIISDNKDVGKILDNIMEKYNMAHPIQVNKNYCFNILDSEFINNHFLALKNSNLIKTNNDKLKFKSFEKLLTTIIR